MNNGLKIIFILLVLTLIAADLPPALPSSFYGTVAGYPAGTKINIWMEGAKVTSTLAFEYLGYGVVYSVNVPGIAEDEGKALTFKTGGTVIGLGVWHSGTNMELNLSAPTRKRK